MSYFAQSAFENIRSKVLRLREKDTPQHRLIITTSVFPPDVTLHLAKMLHNFVIIDKRIMLTFKVAKNVADEWRKINKKVFDEMDGRGWVDNTGNLTGYRNTQLPEDGILGLVVLVGADRIIDSSSLADFYRCDPNVIWQDQMQESFSVWIQMRFNEAHIDYNEAGIERFNIILSDLVGQGCADIFQIAHLLHSLPLEDAGVQDGREALQVLLRGLRRFQLPSFIGFQFLKKKKLRPYLQTAIRFFRYDLFLEERIKNKALETIELLLDKKADEINDNSLFIQDERGEFTSDKAFIEGVREYIKSEDHQAKESLFQSDFIAIHDKILKFKIKVEREPKETVRKISGGPVEVALTALWNTFRDFRKEYTSTIPEIKAIAIRGELFRHDNESLSEGVAAETQERAREYLCKLVGGVDHYFREYLDASSFGNQATNIISNLFHEDISCAHARTAEPSLEFRVELALSEGDQFSKKFAWRLPETQTYRMAEELIAWADDIFERDHSNIILPVFHIRYHEELMRAKDDDETRRVLLHAIRDVAAECTNLITNEWKIQNDPLLPYLTELAFKYRQLINTARKDGLLSIFHKVGNDTPSAWDIFRFSYEKTMRAYQGEDEQCINSPMGAMLMRAFLIIAPREGQNNAWVASPFERNGVATVLHPSVLEMIHHHISYLFACFNYPLCQYK